MSEDQYYEFLAVDRPLDTSALAAVRALSTRARITPTSFVNTYHWGDFRGHPRALVERYYDAFLYAANWGTRQFMFRLPARLPARLLDPDVAGRYCTTDAASTWTRGGHVVINLTYPCEDGGEWDDEDDLGEGKLASIIPARAELAAGDKDDVLLRLLQGDPHVGTELRRRLVAPPPAPRPHDEPRSVAALLDAARARAAERERLAAAQRASRAAAREKAAAAARSRHLDALAAEGEAAWQRVDRAGLAPDPTTAPRPES